jgi:hypothetical protein
MSATVGDLQSLNTAEEMLESANEKADLAALEALLSEDFCYTGGMGGSQTKSAWLGGLLERGLSSETKDREAKTRARAAENNRATVLLLTGLRAGESIGYEVELHGDVGIANRVYSIQDADGSERCLRYVRVYRLESGSWRLLSHRYIHAVD